MRWVQHEKTQYEKLAECWNRKCGLRHGDRALQESTGKRQRIRNNKWIFENIVINAWRSLRDRVNSTGPTEPGDTKREFDLLVGMAEVHASTVKQAARARLHSVAKFEGGLVITSNHDATPRVASFGIHADRLVETARYLIRKVDAPGWRLVSLDEMRKVAGRGWQPKFGVLEFFAQEHSFHWEEDGVYINEKLIWSPLILKKNNVSMVHAGEQVGSGPANWDELVCYAPRCVIVWLLEVIDSCNVNKRKQRFGKMAIADLHPKIVYWPGNCQISYI